MELNTDHDVNDLVEGLAQALYAEYRERCPGTLTWENDIRANEFRATAKRLLPHLSGVVVSARAVRALAVRAEQRYALDGGPSVGLSVLLRAGLASLLREPAAQAADPVEPIKRAVRTLLPGLEVANYAERWAAGSPAVQALTILTGWVGGADVVAGDLQDPHVPTAHPRRPSAEPPTREAQTRGDDVEAVSTPPRDDEFAPGIRTTATGTVVPYVTDQAKQFLAESTSLTEELFDLADLFRVPVTNNDARFEDNDLSRPVYHVGEFIEAITTAVARHQPTTGADAESLPEGGEQR